MEINERIKALRTALGLTQTEFGNKIGFKQNTVGQIENAQRGVTERAIILLAEKYNANEEWLRTGNGDMFKQENAEAVDDKFEALAAEYGLTDLQVELIRTILKFPDNTQKSVVQFICDLADAVSNEDAADKPNGGDDGETGK